MIKVIIPASGSGLRFGGKKPKQFVKIKGIEIIAYTIKKFNSIREIDEIIIPVKENYREKVEQIVRENKLSKVKRIVTGGEHRQDSVYNALINSDCSKKDLILVHDAVRPFISRNKIHELIREAQSNKCVIPAMKVSETVKKVDDNGIIEKTIERKNLWLAQTPQVFEYGLLMRSFEEAIRDGFWGTDEAAIVEHAGYEVKVIEGEKSNIKITTKEDLIFAVNFISGH